MSSRQMAEHIRMMRTIFGLTQEQLAERCGLSRSYIGKIESVGRNLGWKTAERIAFGFGMTVPEFFQATDVFKSAEIDVVEHDGSVTYSVVELNKLSKAAEEE